MGACVRSPQISSKNFIRYFKLTSTWLIENISIIFCEAVAIYGVIMSIILGTKYAWFEHNDNGNISITNPIQVAASCYTILATGLIVGFGNLACGYSMFMN
jgi:V-type H+-transporting ATPase proteolipid subunit